MQFAKRRFEIDASGIRKVFDLAAKMENPCNLSIGQPDYDVPEPVKAAAIEAIEKGQNRYTLTAGTVPLREKLRAHYEARGLGATAQDVIVTAGTSGGLFLCLSVLLDPGDEVLFADPYFVMYKQLARFIGAVPRLIDTYPDFRLTRERLERAWTPRCKMLILNSPNNPTGRTLDQEELETAGQYAEEKGLIVLSDEIYESLLYDGEFLSPAKFTNPERTLIISGLSKSVAMTGWRLGWAVGPKPLVQAMSDVQQYSFVCAPSPAQAAALNGGLDYDISDVRVRYRGLRDLIYQGLVDAGYDVVRPNGAFYIFPKAPCGDGDAFVRRAIENQLLIVPGSVFSDHNTHFRISFAATEAQLRRGLDILRKLNGKA